MGTSVQVTPLSGVYGEAPLCYLLAVDGFNILLDCGWTDHFDPSLLQPLSKIASTIDAVLLSHADILHLGALPFAIKHLGLTAPVFATEPVYRLGFLTMYDHFVSRQQVSNFGFFTLDDIDFAFQNVNRLTYYQNHHFSGEGEGIVISPHVAGHLLGGAIWKITKDGEDVIYAVDYNHRKERHLNGTILQTFVRPSVLITDAYNALDNQIPARQRDKEFTELVVKTLKADGNILLPVDTAGRVLELILLFEQHWSQHHLTYPIFFFTTMTTSTIDYVKGFLEWMSDSIAKSFEDRRNNAFILKHVRLLISKNELDKIPDGPKVVMASMASLEIGFSKEIFIELATEAKNLVIFTERGQFGTLARMLQSDPPPKAVKVVVSKKVPLEGEELVAHEEEENRKKEEALKATLLKEESAQVSDGGEEVADPMVIDSGDTRASSDATSPSLSGHRDIIIDGFVRPQTSVAPMFPCYKSAIEWDDYGEIINPADYIIKDDCIHPTSMFGGGNDSDGKIDETSARILLDNNPSKVVSTEMTVQVKCALVYMDFEGCSDSRSIKAIIGHVSPLKIVLVHGSAESTEHLKEHCLKNVCPYVYSPQIGESVDVTSDVCAYKFQLSEKLMSNIHLKKLGEYEVSWVDAEVHKSDSKLLSRPLSAPSPPHKSVLVGDLKLADFKQFLSSKGVQELRLFSKQLYE